MNENLRLDRPTEGTETSRVRAQLSRKASVESNCGKSPPVEPVSSGTEVALFHRLEKLEAELARTRGVLSTEVQARKQLQVELHESEQRFMVFMDNSPAMAFIKNEDGDYLFANKRWRSFFPHKLPGKEKWNDFLLHPRRTARQIRKDDQQLLATGTCSETVIQHLVKDGSSTWWLYIKFPMLDPRGRPFIGGMAVDITERRRTEEALRASENALADFFYNAPVGLHWLGADGRILRANRAEVRLLGYEIQEYVGRHISEFHVAPDFIREVLKQLRAGEITTYEARLRCKDGTIKHVLTDANVFWSKGRFMHARCFTRDMTDQRLRESQILAISEREQQRIGQDLHDELCQYLTAIKFKSGLLKRQLERHSPKEALQATAIEGMLNVATDRAHRLARGLHPVQVEASGLASALEELAANMAAVYRRHCVCVIHKPVLIHDNTTAIHLYRIAQEAIVNGLKHGKARKIIVTLAARRDAITLSVEDNGVGFSTQLPARNGMGLHIMNYRARTIGATLSLARRNRGGTVLTCTLPRHESRKSC
ncbi:MAG: Multi-sensor signal transduction histidine kinase [Pedosphaera sp.]|nr:Multi-sensor signal transduction histidine kinase [Pedosphaera sp.]